jgi:hypothetical protein
MTRQIEITLPVGKCLKCGKKRKLTWLSNGKKIQEHINTIADSYLNNDSCTFEDGEVL